MEFTAISGAETGQVFSADVSAATIGRGSGNLVAISGSKISRQHARLEVAGASVTVEDLGSTNGTYVNGQRLAPRTPRTLQVGDQIGVADTTLRFDGLASAAWDSGAAAVSEARAGGRPRWLIPAIALLAVALLVPGLVWLLTRNSGSDETPVVIATPDTPTPVTFYTAAPEAISTVRAADASQQADPQATSQAQQAGGQGQTAVGSGQAPAAQGQAGAAQGQLPGAAQGQLPGAAQGQLPMQAGLEQLPAAAGQLFPGVAPEQLPQVIGQAAQGGQLSPTQAQGLIAGMFPGVAPAQLPQAIQRAFPGVPPDQLQAVLNLVFPGQGVSVPMASSLNGRIFYGARTNDNRFQIYQINADGSGKQLLIEDASEPSVSPDRQWLAYYSWRDDQRGLRLHRLSSDGAGEDRTLTTDSNHSYPSWAPDQSRLVFYDYSNLSIQTIAPDGSGSRTIATGEFPAWSPSGDRIAFKGCIDNGKCGIVLVNRDGSNPTRLTTNANDGQPAWSPDGNALTFVSDRDGNWEIYAINADGSWLRRITDQPSTDGLPEWAADGMRIAFRSDRGGVWAIWIASGIGGPASKLVDAETGPNWQWEKISWR